MRVGESGVTSTESQHRLYVVGIGLDGVAGLSERARSLLTEADCIAGYPHHLQQVAGYGAEKLVLGGAVLDWIALVQQELQRRSLVVLASGDPLYFGIGRLLTEAIARPQLVFVPHLSSVQLAFNRLGLPWQSATVVSVHGRSVEELERVLRQGQTPIAVLTDPQWTPGAIAQFLLDVQLPAQYHITVCSRLGAVDETIWSGSWEEAIAQAFPSPNVVILERGQEPLPLEDLPLLGLPDAAFHTFADQPGLITKQEIRALAIAQLQVAPHHTLWDIGAGTGSMSIELARLLPTAHIVAIEKTAAGITLIRQNCQRFGVNNITVVQTQAPSGLADLPPPDRIFLGGGGAALAEILAVCGDRLLPGGMLVANFATLEPCTLAQRTLQDLGWEVRLLQVNLARSSTLRSRSSAATRFVPLNPVTLLRAQKPKHQEIGSLSFR